MQPNAVLKKLGFSENDRLAITPDWRCRAADYETFLKDELRQHIQNIGVQVIGYRDLQRLMVAWSNTE